MDPRTPPSAAWALAALAFAVPCTAQLSGTYTIDPNGTGSGNFKTFGAATSALGSNGVSGPVLLKVSSGTFTESWQIPAIKGVSATNTVTFLGLAPAPTLFLTKLVGGSTHIIDIQKGASNIVIEGFDFVSTTTGVAIQAADAVTNVEVRHCRFGSAIAGDQTGAGHILVNGLDTSNNWSIHDNEFNFGAYTYGIYMNRVQRHHVYRNHFKINGTLFGLWWGDLLWNTNNSRNVIHDNLFTGKTSTSVNACAINMANSSINNDICYNTIAIDTDGYAIWAFGFQNAYNRFYGNLIAVTGKTGGGIYITVGSRNYWQSDGNLFFIQSGVVGRIVNVVYKGLPSWRTATAAHPNGAQDLNSVEGDPKFKSATDLRLAPGSPAFSKGIVLSGRFVPLDDYDGFVRGSKLDIGAFETAGYLPYGQGCPGAGNKTPALSLGGNIGPGDNASIDLANALASSGVVLTAGVNKATISLGGSCLLLNQPLILLFLTSSATGTASLPVSIAPTATVTGSTVYLQYGVADPAAAGGIAVTAGAGVRL